MGLVLRYLVGILFGILLGIEVKVVRPDEPCPTYQLAPRIVATCENLGDALEGRLRWRCTTRGGTAQYDLFIPDRA